MVDLIPSNLIGIVLDCAAQHCFFSSSGHRATSTQCGVEATAISCIGVEVGLQALQVPVCQVKLSQHGTEVLGIADMHCRHNRYAHHPALPVGR